MIFSCCTPFQVVVFIKKKLEECRINITHQFYTKIGISIIFFYREIVEAMDFGEMDRIMTL